MSPLLPHRLPPEGRVMHPSDRSTGHNNPRARAVLLELLLAGDTLPWPGADGLTVEEVLLEYPRAASEGRVPELNELCRRFPALAAEIRLAAGDGVAGPVPEHCQVPDE